MSQAELAAKAFAFQVADWVEPKQLALARRNTFNIIQ